MFLEIVIPFAIVVGAYLLRFLLKKPFYYDPYGKETKRLSKKDNENEFIRVSISDAEKLDNREIKIIGDINEIEQIVQKTRGKGFRIDAITGPIADAKMGELIHLSDMNINIHMADNKPMHHFAIIGPHLFLESPHTTDLMSRSSLGIRYPYANYYDLFKKRLITTGGNQREQLIQSYDQKSMSPP